MIWDLECKGCGTIFRDKYFRSEDERDEFECYECKSLCKPMLPNFNVNMDSTVSGWDPVLETDLRGHSHRKMVMREKGLIERDVNAKGEKRRWV